MGVLYLVTEKQLAAWEALVVELVTHKGERPSDKLVVEAAEAVRMTRVLRVGVEGSSPRVIAFGGAARAWKALAKKLWRSPSAPRGGTGRYGCAAIDVRKRNEERGAGLDPDDLQAVSKYYEERSKKW